MKSEEKILEELELIEHVSVTYIMRKYKLNFEKARELQHRWVDNEPPQPTFSEIVDAYHNKLKAKNASFANSATA